MAASVTLNSPGGRSAAGARYIREGTLNLGTYAAGGVAVTKALFDLWVDISDLNVRPSAGITCEYVKSSGLVKAYSTVKTYTATYDPASLGATTARDDTVTVTGVKAADLIVGFQAAPALTSGLSVQECRISADDTVIVRLNNASAGSIDGASGTWTFYVAKANGAQNEVADSTDLSAVNFPFRAEGH